MLWKVSGSFGSLSLVGSAENVWVSFDFHLEYVDIVIGHYVVLLITGHSIITGNGIFTVSIEHYFIVIMTGIKTRTLAFQAVIAR